MNKPLCFGSKPSYQTQAENDCYSCNFRKTCIYLDATHWSNIMVYTAPDVVVIHGDRLWRSERTPDKSTGILPIDLNINKEPSDSSSYWVEI